MPSYKLTHFDIDGGRAEPIRIAFHMASISFEDHCISFPEFGKMRSGIRFNSVPVLEIYSAAITQSNSELADISASSVACILKAILRHAIVMKCWMPSRISRLA